SFAYYGIRAILLFYFYYYISDGGVCLDKISVTYGMGIYCSMIYMYSFINGWLADIVFGTTQILFYSGILIWLKNIAFTITLNVLFPLFTSICLLVIGTGLLKTNISSAVGDLYSKEDFRRDSGFNVFYTGINMGGLLAPMVVGTLGQKYNFHLGFGVAAIGM